LTVVSTAMLMFVKEKRSEKDSGRTPDFGDGI